MKVWEIVCIALLTITLACGIAIETNRLRTETINADITLRREIKNNRELSYELRKRICTLESKKQTLGTTK